MPPHMPLSLPAPGKGTVPAILADEYRPPSLELEGPRQLPETGPPFVFGSEHQLSTELTSLAPHGVRSAAGTENSLALVRMGKAHVYHGGGIECHGHPGGGKGNTFADLGKGVGSLTGPPLMVPPSLPDVSMSFDPGRSHHYDPYNDRMVDRLRQELAAQELKTAAAESISVNKHAEVRYLREANELQSRASEARIERMRDEHKLAESRTE